MVWTPERAAVDLTLIMDPDNWPIWPVLPLKRELSRPPSEGFLYGDPPAEGEKVTVFIGNIYGTSKLSDLRKLYYDSVESMLNDGWMVD